MLSIKDFVELREAGYTVDQIKEYASLADAPAPEPQKQPDPQPAPEPQKQESKQPEKTAEEILADYVRPEAPKDPTQEQVKEIKDTLSMLLGAVRGMNINQLQMPAGEERGTHEILAEIINPPGKGGK